MALISEVAEGIYEIKPEGEAVRHFPLCTVYLVVDEKIALVEAGSPVQTPDILEAVQKLGYPPESISYLLLTHVHPDHAGGAGLLAAQARKAKVVAHARAAKFLADPSLVARMVQGWKQAFGPDAEERFGAMPPLGEDKFHPVNGQDLISLGKRGLKAIHTPGHDPYHLSFWDSRTRGLFCGDAVGFYSPETGVVSPCSAPGIDPVLMAQSVEELRSLNPAVLFFSHGGTCRAAETILRKSADNTRTNAQIVLEALRKGESPEEISSRLIEALAGGSTSAGESLRKFPYWTSLCVEGYRQYYKRKNMI